MTNAAAELLASKPNVLLDFDGPVCSVFGGVGANWVAAELRRRLGLTDEHSLDTRDPFDILCYAAADGHRQAVAAEHELTRLEIEAVASAPATPGAEEMLKSLRGRKQVVIVVSNNSAAAVRAYVNAHRLTHLIAGISARTNPNPQRLKPNKFLLQQAIDLLNATPASCVMIGDSISDIEAAKAAGTAVIAYANKPGKKRQLLSHEPDLTIDDIADLVP